MLAQKLLRGNSALGSQATCETKLALPNGQRRGREDIRSYGFHTIEGNASRK